MLISSPQEMAIYSILKTAIEELIKVYNFKCVQCVILLNFLLFLKVKLIINVKEEDKFDRIPNINAEKSENFSTTQKLYEISK